MTYMSLVYVGDACSCVHRYQGTCLCLHVETKEQLCVSFLRKCLYFKKKTVYRWDIFPDILVSFQMKIIFLTLLAQTWQYRLGWLVSELHGSTCLLFLSVRIPRHHKKVCAHRQTRKTSNVKHSGLSLQRILYCFPPRRPGMEVANNLCDCCCTILGLGHSWFPQVPTSRAWVRCLLGV